MHEKQRKLNVDEKASETELPVFICYRQADGADAAKWLHHQLHGKRVDSGGSALRLNVYLDTQAPAVANWKAIHLPSLQRAKALVFVSTPGSYAKVGNDDWVHQELDWWIEHRTAAPIVVATTDDDSRWIPVSLTKNWKDLQRVAFKPSDDSILQPIIQGILLSGTSVLFEDVDRNKKLLKGYRLSLSGIVLLFMISFVGLALTLRVNSQLRDSSRDLKVAQLTIEKMDSQLRDSESHQNDVESAIKGLQEILDKSVCASAVLTQHITSLEKEIPIIESKIRNAENELAKMDLGLMLTVLRGNLTSIQELLSIMRRGATSDTDRKTLSDAISAANQNNKHLGRLINLFEILPPDKEGTKYLENVEDSHL